MFVHLVSQCEGNFEKNFLLKISPTHPKKHFCTLGSNFFFWNFQSIDRPNAQTFNVGLITEPKKIHFGIISGKIDYKKNPFSLEMMKNDVGNVPKMKKEQKMQIIKKKQQIQKKFLCR